MKTKTRQETLELTAGIESFTALKQFTNEELAKRGIFRSSENHFTFGTPMNPGEYEGEGLPEDDLAERLYTKGEITFSFRFSYNAEGEVILEVAQKGSGRHFKFPFKGLDQDQAHFAATEFEQRLYLFLYKYAIYNLMAACCEKRLNNSDDIAKKSLTETVDWFESYFKSMLMPKRFKTTDIKEYDGVRIITSEEVSAGRKLKSVREREMEKAEFVANVFRALKQIETKGRKRTQLEVGEIIFANLLEDIPSAMSKHLKKFRLKWKDLVREYDEKMVKN